MSTTNPKSSENTPPSSNANSKFTRDDVFAELEFRARLVMS